MRGKKGRYGHSLLLMLLFLGLSLGIFFSSTKNADATPQMSPDGKTCTPCHTDGRTAPAGTAGTAGATGAATGTSEGTGASGGGATAGAGQEQKPEQKPAEQKADVQSQAPAAMQAAPVAKEKTSPVIVIGLVAVVLGVICFVAIKKR